MLIRRARFELYGTLLHAVFDEDMSNQTASEKN
jgi:hypothetical protein